MTVYVIHDAHGKRQSFLSTVYIIYTIVPTQVEKIRAKLANLNYCAVPFLSRAAVTL